MNPRKALNQRKIRRQRRSRAKIFGQGDRPRLAVFRSNRFIYAQLIDDNRGRTLVSASSRELGKSEQQKSKTEQANLVGALAAKKALALGLKKVVLDRRSYKYHGRIKALADGARKAGLKI